MRFLAGCPDDHMWMLKGSVLPAVPAWQIRILADVLACVGKLQSSNSITPGDIGLMYSCWPSAKVMPTLLQVGGRLLAREPSSEAGAACFVMEFGQTDEAVDTAESRPFRELEGLADVSWDNLAGCQVSAYIACSQSAEARCTASADQDFLGQGWQTSSPEPVLC